MTEQTEKRSYKQTLNLPKTPFPMKANLVQNEPASLKRWTGMNLYQRLRQAPHPKGRFVFHDGPPYANGSIHLGHLLNKVLKDIVVRARTMEGHDVPYVPGWDCHGLPIEHKVVAELGNKAREMEPLAIRRKCQASAEKFVKLQSGQMQRLLTLADYDNPYLTMQPAYEAESLEVFAQLVEKGLVYRALKPVHWSIANRTALAEAELEYEDREDTSVYVRFPVRQTPAFFEGSDLEQVAPHLMAADLLIWTTTPWTLPANLAVAVHCDATYGIYRSNGRHLVVAVELAKRVLAHAGVAEAEPLATLPGKSLVDTLYSHPFIDRTSPVVAADYVTLEDGTGLVHTAPGHGVEDYHTGLRVGLPIYCPVKGDGTFDDTAPDWLRGVDVWQGNSLVVEKLRQSGHLFYAHQFTHSYPHDWRSKTPTIFRATEQWFVSVDKPIESNQPSSTIRERALAAAQEQVRFYPEWGRNRLRGMLESRPDWCISRQRAWGLPIPVFFREAGSSDFLLTAASVRAVATVIAKHGSDAWFKATPAELLAAYDPANDPDAPAWINSATGNSGGWQSAITRGADIFDVWFDSGTSWAAVIGQRFGPEWLPTDLYLEGSDQHRGWFQASLLPAVATTGLPPYKAVLTHGFMVDKDGRKMSKSLGNALEVDTLLKDHGADVCRWWVSSINTDNDIKVDPEFFRLAGEEYRKVRNTIKYLLSNLYDFRSDGGADSTAAGSHYAFADADATSLDAWTLGELNQLITAVRHGYLAYDFRAVHEALFNFCNETLSAVYLAATKDRMYCDRPDSARRRRTQTAMHLIAGSLARLVAPILPHSADEAWRLLHPGEESCVHLQLFPEPADVEVSSAWQKVFGPTGRDTWLRLIEAGRQRLGIDNPLDCGLAVTVPPQELPGIDPVDLADLCGISQFHLGTEQDRVLDLREEPRCDRSWKRDGTVKLRGDGGLLTDRDAEALGLV